MKDLETELGFIGYYRKFVPGYAHIAGPLIQLKTQGFKDASTQEKARAFYTFKSNFNCDKPLVKKACTV